MAVEVDISIFGDKALQRKFKKLGPTLQKQVLRKAFRGVAKDILADARIRVPKDTGALAKSLKVKALKRSRGKIGVKVETGTREQLGIAADDPYYYPAAIELGTKKQSVQSFLRSSLEINRGPGLQKIKKAIQFGIKNAKNL